MTQAINDPFPDTDDPLYIEHFYSIPEADLDTIFTEAKPLYTALHDTVENYCEAHPDTTESIVLYAADSFLGCIKATLREDLPAAEPPSTPTPGAAPMTQSFYDLTPPHPDHVCITRAELAYQEHVAYMEHLSPAEEDAVMAEAVPLANALYRVINDVACTEASIAFGAIVEALHLVQARIDQEMTAVDQDDCDA